MEAAEKIRLADKKEAESNFSEQIREPGNIQDKIRKPEEEEPKTKTAASDSINPEDAGPEVIQKWPSEDPTLEKAAALAREPKQREETRSEKKLSFTDMACYIASRYQRGATVKIFDLWNSWYFPYSAAAQFPSLHTIYPQLVILESTKPRTEYYSAITGLVCSGMLPIIAVRVRFARGRKERDMEHELR